MEYKATELCTVPNNLSLSINSSQLVVNSPEPSPGSLSVIQPMVLEQTKPWPYLKQPMPMIIILTLAYVIVFLLGVVNNCLVVSVIYRNRQLRTVTNYFIANLAVADIMVCILVLPITLFSNIFYGEYTLPRAFSVKEFNVEIINE